jgi:hypothetical protein
MALIHVVFPDPVAPITKIVLHGIYSYGLGWPREYRLAMTVLFSNGNVYNFIWFSSFTLVHIF